MLSRRAVLGGTAAGAAGLVVAGAGAAACGGGVAEVSTSPAAPRAPQALTVDGLVVPIGGSKTLFGLTPPFGEQTPLVQPQLAGSLAI